MRNSAVTSVKLRGDFRHDLLDGADQSAIPFGRGEQGRQSLQRSPFAGPRLAQQGEQAGRGLLRARAPVEQRQQRAARPLVGPHQLRAVSRGHVEVLEREGEVEAPPQREPARTAGAAGRQLAVRVETGQLRGVAFERLAQLGFGQRLQDERRLLVLAPRQMILEQELGARQVGGGAEVVRHDGQRVGMQIRILPQQGAHLRQPRVRVPEIETGPRQFESIGGRVGVLLGPLGQFGPRPGQVPLDAQGFGLLQIAFAVPVHTPPSRPEACHPGTGSDAGSPP